MSMDAASPAGCTKQHRDAACRASASSSMCAQKMSSTTHYCSGCPARLQLGLTCSPIVAIWLRSPHSARKVSTNASTNTGDSCAHQSTAQCQALRCEEQGCRVVVCRPCNTGTQTAAGATQCGAARPRNVHAGSVTCSGAPPTTGRWTPQGGPSARCRPAPLPASPPSPAPPSPPRTTRPTPGTEGTAADQAQPHRLKECLPSQPATHAARRLG